MRYVAVGDSFTEGLGDDLPDGSVRGWADLVAAGLADAEPGQVQYANLAIRGRLLDPIVNEQLEAALALSPAPTLVTLNGGAVLVVGHEVDGRFVTQSEVGPLAPVSGLRNHARWIRFLRLAVPRLTVDLGAHQPGLPGKRT